MGGSGGGGGFSPSDAAQVQKAAEARLKNIASKSTKVLFICETIDRKSLESHLEQSKVFPKSRTVVIDGGKANTIDAALDSTTFLVPFTGVHVKAQPKSLVPAKVSAYSGGHLVGKS
ncbi:MAG: hypothetical protein WCF74_24320 [Candidatus Sulfotelmatobacter sp.]